MISKISLLVFLCFLNAIAFSQTQFSPNELLGYEIGQKFTRHNEVVNYFQALEKAFPSNLKVEKYGETYENRDLILAYIGAAENLSIVCGAPNVAKGQKVIVATVGTTL
jgi:hypothetical protein